ncbi:MAG: magnesium/cobalt transporter CorA [Flavobacteriales bacterium]
MESNREVTENDPSYNDSGSSHHLKKVGLPPGSLIYTGKRGKEAISLDLISYSKNEHTRKPLDSYENLVEHLDQKSTNFLTICGVHDEKAIASIGKQLGIHSLVLEDIMEVNQRPKLEVFEEFIFFSAKMLGLSKKKNKINKEQISVLLSNKSVLVFQEQKGDIFDGIRERLAQNAGLTRQKHADFLVYRLLDTIIDHYFIAADHLGRRIERIEVEIVEGVDQSQIATLLRIKKEIMMLRKLVIPLKDAINTLSNLDHPVIAKANEPYFRDILEHNIEVIEMLEVYRETVISLIDLHQSLRSNQMNEVMKVLTIISTIFIPLSFIVGLYGMNFKYIPELDWQYGYAIVWGVIICIISGLLFFFKRKRWL